MTIVFDRSGPGRYVPIGQAARVLGVHRDVLRRRARRGLLDARQAVRPQGTAWEVWLPEEQAQAAQEDVDATCRPPSVQVAPPGVHLALGGASELLATLAAAAAATERTAQATAELAARLAEATLRADRAEAALREALAARDDPPPQRSSESWWRFWR